MNLRTLLSALLLSPLLLHAADTKTSTAAKKTEPKTVAVQVTVDLEWIVMPHVEVNRLLRETLKSAGDQKDLRVAVEQMITQKTARRMDSASLVVADGKKGKSEALSTKPCPVDWRFDAAADGSFTVKTTATTERKIGRIVEVEATVASDNRRVLLNLSTEHAGWLGDLSWPAGKDSITQPVFTNMTAAERVWVNAGEWYCQGVFHTWSAPPDGLKSGVEPPGTDRVLLFSRATVNTARPAAEPAPARPGCLVLCEWMEADADMVAQLTKQAGKTGGETVRKALQDAIPAGKATLVETTLIPVLDRERTKAESLREHPWPVTFDLDAARAFGRARLDAENKARESGKPATLPAAVAAGEGREAPISFQARSLGLSIEVEAFREEPGEWELNIGSDFSQLQARESGSIAPPSGSTFVASAARVQQFNISSAQVFPVGKTVVAGTKQGRGGGWRGRGGDRGGSGGGGRGEGGGGGGGDRAGDSGDRAEGGADRADRGGDRADRGGDRADRGGDRTDRGGDRADRGGDRADGDADRADGGADRPRGSGGDRGGGGGRDSSGRPRKSMVLFVKVLE